MKKRGVILAENVIFIVLNLVFLAMLILFLAKQGGGVIIVEQTYAKQIALLIDSAKPGMTIRLNMEKVKKLTDKNKMDFSEAVKINGNVVSVKLTKDSGYEYSFFNDVDASAYPDVDSINYIIKINKYKT